MTKHTPLGYPYNDDVVTSEGTIKATGHTPGPWKTTTCFLDLYVVRDEGEGSISPIARMYKIGKIKNGKFILDKETIEANARLIAAAPDLLYTLQTVEHNITSLTSAYPEYHHSEDWGGTLKIVREAIEKAGGETI